MAVAEWRLASAGASGAATGDSPLFVQTRFNAVYMMRVDDALDGPATILRYFRSSSELPWFGDGFDYGNDRDTASKCKSIAPDRIPKSNWFTVRVDFEPLQAEEPEQGQDESGNSTDNPLLWHDEVSADYTQINIPVEVATFQGVKRGNGRGQPLRFRRIGEDGPVVNSANVVYDPPPQQEVDIKIFRLSRNVAEYNANNLNFYIGKVNSDQVTINKPRPYRFRDLWRPLTARIKIIGGAFQFTNNVFYWKQSVEVHILPFPLTWRKLVVDRGLERRQMPGDINEGGAEISASDIVAGQPAVKRIVDQNGYPVTTPVLLDGNGQPLPHNKPPVYLEYQVYGERAFAGFRW